MMMMMMMMQNVFLYFLLSYLSAEKNGNMQFRFILLFGLILGLEITENYHSLNLSR